VFAGYVEIQCSNKQLETGGASQVELQYVVYASLSQIGGQMR
jgi:hypothetical protein